MKSFAIALIALACASPAFAERDTSAAREITVGYSDLDLSTPQGRATFGQRVNYAIDNVCAQTAAPAADQAQCRRETRIDVMQQSRGEVRTALANGAPRRAEADTSTR
jgi:UrcA family protein